MLMCRYLWPEVESSKAIGREGAEQVDDYHLGLLHNEVQNSCMLYCGGVTNTTGDRKAELFHVAVSKARKDPDKDPSHLQEKT